MFSLMPWKKQRNDASALANRTEHPLNFFRNQFDSILDSFFGRWTPLLSATWPGMGIDAADHDDAVIVRVDAPGFESDDFDIQVSRNELNICARHYEDSTSGSGAPQRYFERSVTLPAGIDPHHVEASYRNGVLEVRLPKTEQARPRKITVKST